MSTVQQKRGIRQRRWSKTEYYRLGELGFFHGQRVELIEGKLMVLSPQNALHAAAIARLTELLPPLFGASYHLRVQLPLDLGQTTEPEPDIVLLAGSPGQYVNNHPTSAALLLEVSDTTLAFDRRRKGSLYARAGIADYWIVNLVARQLEVYRAPVADAAAPFGFRYSSRVDLLPPATVTPLALPHVSITVAALFP